MKPKHLKCPMTWETRCPLVEDRVLYVPQYYEGHEKFDFPGWESEALFGRSAPIHVEYCAGNGAWIVEKALQNPDINWIAVEIQFERVRKIWSKICNHGLKNLIVVCGEALTFTKHYVQPEEFSGVYVNFPDPWPKDKHAKNRLLKVPFFSELARVCQEGSELMIATDHHTYATFAISELQKSPGWGACYKEPHYIHDYPDYGTSYFDALFRDMGREIHYIQYKKVLCPSA